MEQYKVEIAIDMAHIFWPDLIEVDGSVFLSGDALKKTSDPEHNLERTGMEAFLNHTHMIDLFHHNADRNPRGEDDDRFYDHDHPDFLALCKAGKIIAQMWFQKLRLDFPQYNFRVYYTQDDNPVVRFHRVRAEEPNWIEEEKYAEEIKCGKVIIYDSRKMSPMTGGV